MGNGPFISFMPIEIATVYLLKILIAWWSSSASRHFKTMPAVCHVPHWGSARASESAPEPPRPKPRDSASGNSGDSKTTEQPGQWKGHTQPRHLVNIWPHTVGMATYGDPGHSWGVIILTHLRYGHDLGSETWVSSNPKITEKSRHFSNFSVMFQYCTAINSSETILNWKLSNLLTIRLHRVEI
jgi:hypothetical protein